jgi:hypothetical protein
MGTLAGNYYGGIVRNGLVLMLDAAKKESYDRLGTTWRDISWNGNNGVLTNFSSPSPQTIWDSNNGGSIVFDGTNDYVKPPNTSLYQFSDFTISVWFKVTVLNINQFLVDTSSDASNGYGYSFRVKSDNKIRFWAYDANNFLDTSVTVTTNTWYNLVVNYNNTSKTQNIYINGVLSVSNTHTNTFTPSTISYLQIGASQLLSGPLKGNMSQILFYNRTLSASEVLQNFNATKDRYLTSIPFEYFVLAGGGSAGGNGGGGGGAGGLLVGSNYVIENTTLTVTVGSGGGGVGSNSSLIGGIISVVSTGGGIGTTRDGNYGTTGGSGAGGAGWTQSNSAESGFAGISGQGSSGGNGTNYSLGGSSAGGGGGGYSSSGTNASSQQGGNGGNGYLLPWNGIGYAGGGAGSGLDYSNFFGRAGTVQAGYGGGGPQNSSANGRVNSGGGGGSLANATNSGWSGGGAGGSGTVILKIGGNLRTTTGNPSIINNGSHYLYVFSGTGTITI